MDTEKLKIGRGKNDYDQGSGFSGDQLYKTYHMMMGKNKGTIFLCL
ncbi:MAG: hypothetical protein ACOCRO_04340 [Halanaerobiales bacterium]